MQTSKKDSTGFAKLARLDSFFFAAGIVKGGVNIDKPSIHADHSILLTQGMVVFLRVLHKI
jgi:hypothetical protein